MNRADTALAAGRRPAPPAALLALALLISLTVVPQPIPSVPSVPSIPGVQPIEAGAAGPRQYVNLNRGEVLDLGELFQGQAAALARVAVEVEQEPALLERLGASLRFRAREPGYARIRLRAGELRRELSCFISPSPSRHADREDLDWYRTQFDTGGRGNCGPSVVSMAIRWATGTDIPVQAVRGEIGYPWPDGSTSFDDLVPALRGHGIPVTRRAVREPADLMRVIDSGHLAFVAFTCGGVPRVKGDPRLDLIGRYYEYANGHFVIVKGYSLDGRYLIVYDPYPSDWASNALRYADGTSMIGRNRYYPAAQLFAALQTREILEISR